jgi:hypothetical protein
MYIRGSDLLATIDDRAVIEKILRHLELPVELPTPAPARVAGWLPVVRYRDGT